MSGGARLEGRARRVLFALLRCTGLPLLMRHTVQRHGLTILLFHQQTPELFERSVRALKRRYNLVSLPEALDALDSGSLAALPKRPLAITFDDGRASNAGLIPIFERYTVRPTVFVTTGIVGTHRHFWWTHLTREQLVQLQRMPEDERVAELTSLGLDPEREFDEPQALTLDELRALSRVADIEPHTRMHPVLTSCSDEQVRNEVAGSMADVRELVGSEPRVFAYPNGVLSDRITAVLAQCGIRHAVTTEPVVNGADSDPLRLGRIFVRDAAGVSELIVFASGLHGAIKRVIRHNS